MSDAECLESLTKIFEEFDTDKSGKIDVKELKEMVKVYFETRKLEVNDKTIRESVYDLMKNLDDDGDGTISLDEWLLLVKKRKHPE